MFYFKNIFLIIQFYTNLLTTFYYFTQYVISP